MLSWHFLFGYSAWAVYIKLDLSEEFGSCWVVNTSVGLAEMWQKCHLPSTVSGWGEGSSKDFLKKEDSLTPGFGTFRQHCDCDISGVLVCFDLRDPIKHLEMGSCLLGVFFRVARKLPLPLHRSPLFGWICNSHLHSCNSGLWSQWQCMCAWLLTESYLLVLYCRVNVLQNSPPFS